MKQFHRARMQASRSPCQTLQKGLLTAHLPTASVIPCLDAKQAPTARPAGKSVGDGAGNRRQSEGTTSTALAWAASTPRGASVVGSHGHGD